MRLNSIRAGSLLLLGAKLFFDRTTNQFLEYINYKDLKISRKSFNLYAPGKFISLSLYTM